MKAIHHLTMIASFLWQFYSNSDQACPRGYRVQTTTAGLEVCVQCENGVSFQPNDNHTSRQCFDCSQVENLDLEIAVTNCNFTHDTQILCRAGFYRNQARHLREKDNCERCTQCRNSARNCGGYNDTICCLPNHDAVVVDNEMFKCQNGPNVCGVGQYMKPATAECMPCPEGFFMSDSNHTNNKCWKCATLSNNVSFHSEIVRACNVSTQTIFGCKNGYFRDDVRDSVMVEVECSPCQSCLREARKCDMYHDAVCHNDAVTLEEMEVLDRVTDSKNNGTHSSPICPDGYYISISANSSGCNHCNSAASTSESSSNLSDMTIPHSAASTSESSSNLSDMTIPHSATSTSESSSNLSETTPQNWACYPNVYNTSWEFRAYSIILFVLAILVDILYIFLYSRTFLKKVSIRFSRRNSSLTEKLSRIIGTVCLDVHFVLIFIHLFGTLCELRVISMGEDTLWTFTVAVGIISLLVYFADAIVFIVVKRVVSVKACFKRRGQNTRSNGQSSYDDGQAMIDSTEV